MTVFAGAFVFIYFAYKRPIHHNLYKELLQSLIIGAGATFSYLQYYRFLYLKEVDFQYERMLEKFQRFPDLKQLEDSPDILKNFGFNRFADSDEEEPDYEDEIEQGIFEGTDKQGTMDAREKVIDYIYGS